MCYVFKCFVLSVLILNKNILLFSLFERYHLQCIVDIACLIFYYYSSLLLLISLNVSHWIFSFTRRCFGDPSISRKETNYHTVSSISHLYLGELPSSPVDYHTRDGSFDCTKRSLSHIIQGPCLYLKFTLTTMKEKGVVRWWYI